MRQSLPSPSPVTAGAPPARPLFFPILALITLVASVVLVFTGYAQPVVMGIVQGLGEFLPISSSAHLILVPWFFGWNDASIGTLTFDIALHIGTLVAVIGYFWRDWVALIQGIPAALRWLFGQLRREQNVPLPQNASMLLAVAVATIPGGIAGLLFEDWIETTLRSPLLIAGTLTVMGLLLWYVDRRQPEARDMAELTWRDAALIGIAQVCALVPGVSRSGSTMTMGRLLKLDRGTAARFSFLMSVPITLAAVVLKLDDMFRIPASEIGVFLAGIFVSAAVGALAIHFLLAYIRRAGFGIFAIYRVFIAILILVMAFTRS